jgi:hypothetical protein
MTAALSSGERCFTACTITWKNSGLFKRLRGNLPWQGNFLSSVQV